MSVALFCVGIPQVEAQSSVVRGWIERLEATDELLRQGQWEKAKRKSEKLLRDLSRGLVARGSELIGWALLQRGLAQEGLGEHQAALWDTFAADAFASELRVKLERYGLPAMPLLENLLAERPSLDVVVDSGRGLLALTSSVPKSEAGSTPRPEPLIVGGEVEPPEKRSGPDPDYPEAARAGRVEDLVIVQVVLDKEGRPNYPSILRGGTHPVLALHALEAVKDWRFAPARLHGQPVDVYYTLTVNFALQR